VNAVVSSILLVLFFPVTLAVALMILICDGNPVLFTQLRAGYRGQPFRLYKFRSMSNATGSDGQLLPDRARLASWGRLLRASSLDELPQLWNVLCGDMNLVGPRPLPLIYLPRYSERQQSRHDVRPGITGWAQVNGRNALTWDEKFELDVWYVRNHSLWLDVKILWLTLLRVLRPTGISAAGEATMSEFLGTAGRVSGTHQPAGETPGVNSPRQ
jgi:lipopolysaccharide/colanic/teichoic acid biosynthesis glycosyltransferase